tara:strand:- start:88 stop:222 length:135 start_codon:yes stop_codon:yes gene_type:complete
MTIPSIKIKETKKSRVCKRVKIYYNVKNNLKNLKKKIREERGND